MSVLEENKLDAVGVSKDGTTLALMISDHLDWVNEYEHLVILQKKINSYLGYIESKQYEAMYPDSTFNSFVIQIGLQYEPTVKYYQFVSSVNNQLKDLHVFIYTEHE